MSLMYCFSFPFGQTQIDVRVENETVWLTQAQMAELFQSSRTNIVEHIQHIYEDEELEENPTCRKFRQVRQEGNRMVTREIPMYNLDMIISVGYRVNSKRGVKFRQWANRILKQFLIKGFAINDRIRQEQICELRQLVQVVGRAITNWKGDDTAKPLSIYFRIGCYFLYKVLLPRHPDKGELCGDDGFLVHKNISCLE